MVGPEYSMSEYITIRTSAIGLLVRSFFMHSSHDFLGPSLLSFPWYFMLHDLTYLGADISTDDMTIPLQMSLNYEIFDLHDNTHPIPKNISRHPINQPHSTHHPDHMMLHPTQPHSIHNSKFPRFTTVQ